MHEHLHPHHLEQLRASGLSDDVIAARGYRTVTRKSDLRPFGFTSSQIQTITEHSPGLLLPVYTVHSATEPAFHQLRPDRPRIDREGKAIKYETPSSARLGIDIPPAARHGIGDPQRALLITEGVKKADAAGARGLCCVALLGVWNWRGGNEFGGRTALPDWEQFDLSADRPVFIVFDSDVMLKKTVYQALLRHYRYLHARGARQIQVIYLPGGEGPNKVGLDDFLAKCDAGQELFSLLKHAEAKPRHPELLDDDRDQPDYQYAAGGMWWLQRTERGPQRVQLSNVQARIVADIVQDDGTEHRQRALEIEAFVDLNGHSAPARRYLVRAEDFDGLDWIRKEMGARAIIWPGAGVKERLRHAIQILSGDISEQTRYTHLGWRTITGVGEDERLPVWTYLHASGALTPRGTLDGVRGEPSSLSRYRLPDPAEGDELRDAIRRSLQWLDVADSNQTWPILAAMYAAPLASILAADFVVWIKGDTGGRKSSAVASALCHFGAFDRGSLPANFDSTPNQVERLLFEGKDVPVVVDDYRLAPDRKTQERMDAVAERLLRSVGDLRGRGRMASDSMAVRQTYYPRCLAMATGEVSPPGGQSSALRVFEVDWIKSRVDLARLGRAQQEDAEHYPKAMAAFVQYLAPQMERLRTTLPDRVRALAARMPVAEGRIQEAAAKLYLGVSAFLRFAHQVEAITADEMQVHLNEAWAVFCRCARRTSLHQAERRPSIVAVEGLRALLVRGRIYLADRRTGQCPDTGDPSTWGYAFDNGKVTPRPGAEKIGWVDTDKGWICLESTAAHEILTRYAAAAGFGMAGSKRGMGEALHRDGYLLATYPDRWDYNLRAEGGKHWCWILSLDLLQLGDDDDAPPPPPADPPSDPVSPPPQGPETRARCLSTTEGWGDSGGTGGTGGTDPVEGAICACTTSENDPRSASRSASSLPPESTILEAEPAELLRQSSTASRMDSAENSELETPPSPESCVDVTENHQTPPRLQFAHPPNPSPRQCVRVFSATERAAAVQELAQYPVLGLDTETTGLNPRKDKVRLLQLAAPDGRVWLVDCGQVDPRPLWPVLRERTVVGHHLQFDLGMLWPLGLVPGRVDCSYLQARMLSASGDERPREWHSLAACVRREFGMELSKAEQRSDWGGALSEAQLEYAARDPWVTLQLWQRQRDMLHDAGMDAVARIESRCLPAVVWMCQAGVPFDGAAWSALAEQAATEADALRVEMDTIAPPAPEQLSLGQGWHWEKPEIVKRVFRLLGVSLTNTGDDQLARIDHPLAGLLRRFRAAQKLASGYGDSWMEHAEGDRLYPHWKQLGSRAGRMSCEEPNVQQPPRAAAYRACFRAAPGRVLVKADYSQIELRLAARISGDQVLLQAYRDGADVHTLTARALLGRDFADERERKEFRQLAKAVNFGLLYGMGAAGLQGYARASYGVEMTEQEARRYRDRWFRTYAGVRRWHGAQPRDAIETRTVTGRRRSGVEWHTQKLNSPVQGTGADGLKRAMALLWERRDQSPDARLVIACHDELVVECDEASASTAAAWLEQAMLDGMRPLCHPVPAAVEVQVGSTWAG